LRGVGRKMLKKITKNSARAVNLVKMEWVFKKTAWLQV
jgi:hypothetical protein